MREVSYSIGKGLIVLALIFLVLQLIPVRIPPSNSLGVNGTPTRNTGMPPDMAQSFQRACGDCHSNLTKWPWYSRVAPVSWMVRRDVARGRQALNFSEWPLRDPKQKAVAASSLLAACGALRDGSMPPRNYRLVHREARLSNREIQAYCEWSDAQFRKLMSQ